MPTSPLANLGSQLLDRGQLAPLSKLRVFNLKEFDSLEIIATLAILPRF